MAHDGYSRGSYDPDYDEIDADEGAQRGALPEVVKTFVVYLYRHIRERNVYEIHQMYEGSFNKLTDRMFTQSPWPSVEAIAPVVENDHVFCLLYKEMYFRHVYARLQPTLEQRCESWENYCQLFQVVLQGNLNVQLPNLWLWDMVDEFVYQFQSFCQYRAKLQSKSEDEVAKLRQCVDTVWAPSAVLDLLLSLISSSNIAQTLEDDVEGKSNFTATEGYDYEGSGSNVLRTLGYFSLVGACRVHCLLGDYTAALQSVVPLRVNRSPAVFQRIVGCHISVAYYYAFASLMERRYVDAAKSLNQILVLLLRTKQFHEQSPQYDQILKKNEQMYALLALCTALCPHGNLTEESVGVQLREKYGDKITRMQAGDENTLDELFSFCCPKFVTPTVPSFDGPPVNYNQEAYRQQLSLFLGQVQLQLPLLRLRSLLKLFTAVPLTRLAQLLPAAEAGASSGDEEERVRSLLADYKRKTEVTDADGTVTSNSDIDFSIEDGVIHVTEKKATKKFGDYFIRHILKFDEIVSELATVQLEA